MIINRKIKQRLQASAPQPKDHEIFMADTIRQINLMPSPEGELQKSLKRYKLMERLTLRMDAFRWVMLSGTGSAVIGYVMFSNYDVIASHLITLLHMLP